MGGPLTASWRGIQNLLLLNPGNIASLKGEIA